MTDLERLIAAYKTADKKGQEYLKSVQHDKGIDNVIATINMNAMTYVKSHLESAIGNEIMKEEK